VIAWSYLTESEIKRYSRNDELRCMDYIDSDKMQKLFVGTERGALLTIDIEDLIEFDNLGEDYSVEEKEGSRF
jgi:hypothetical protein